MVINWSKRIKLQQKALKLFLNMKPGCFQHHRPGHIKLTMFVGIWMAVQLVKLCISADYTFIPRGIQSIFLDDIIEGTAFSAHTLAEQLKD